MSSTKQDEDEKGSWVVQGSNLKVKDHDGLYICDASVFPSMVSNPPALTLCALGYEFAQIVLTEDMDIEKRTAR
jgi:choline dehydrogenase-like flavoprotein